LPAVDRTCGARGEVGCPWEEYRPAHPDGFGYSWFYGHYEAFSAPVATDDAAKARRRERVFIISAPEIPNSISAVSSISDLDSGRGGVAREGWAGVRERPGIAAIEALGALSRRQPLVECMTAYFHT